MSVNKTNQPCKFRTRNWVEINDESQETYDVNNQIKSKTSMIRPNLCNYSDAYVHVKGTAAVPNISAQGAAQNNRKKRVQFKNCAPFISCMSKSNNAQVDDAHDIDVVKPMYNLIKNNDTYSKTSEILWQFYRDKPALNNNAVITDFPADNSNSISFKFRRNRRQLEKRC